MDRTISVFVVEDDSVVLEYVRGLIQNHFPFVFGGGFTTAEEALLKIPQSNPGVILMDIGLPLMDGIECTRKLRHCLPFTPIIIFSVYNNAQQVLDAIKAGANGYLTKETAPHELRAALQQAVRGECPLSPSVTAHVLDSVRGQGRQSHSFTDREVRILKDLAGGLLYKEIAFEQKISFATVHYHVRNIFKKMGVRSRSQAVARFLSRTVSLAGLFTVG